MEANRNDVVDQNEPSIDKADLLSGGRWRVGAEVVEAGGLRCMGGGMPIF